MCEALGSIPSIKKKSSVKTENSGIKRPGLDFQ
jgi:hypothetical protein